MNITVNSTGISPYAIFFLLALFLGFLIAYLLLRKEGIEARIARLSILMNGMFVLFFGKMYTMIFSAGDGVGFLQAGFSSVGGLIGMLLGIEMFNLIYREKADVFRTVYVLIIPLIYSVSKLGCFSVGCCYGIPYNGFLHVCYTAGSTDANSSAAKALSDRLPKGNVFPVQLVETIVFFIIFLLFFTLYLRNKRKWLMQKVILLGAAAKFSLEYLRASNIGRIMNPNQVVCVLLFIGSCVWIHYCKRNRVKKPVL